MFCPNCGKEINEDSVFCPECGWKNQFNKPKKNKNFSVLFLLICISVICIILFRQFINNEPLKILSNITSVKLVTEYDTETLVDQMETVKFGSYYQSNSHSKEPIDWLILDRQENKALLLSKYILSCVPYNNEKKDVTWEQSDLRVWLNNTFINTAFNNNEQSYILTANLINNNNIDYGTTGGNNTNDKVFCLSIDEVNNYFIQSNNRSEIKRLATYGTNFAKTVDNGVNKLSTYSGNNWAKDYSCFWLRTPGELQNMASDILVRGSIHEQGSSVDSHSRGVRPALWVDISSFNHKNTVSNGWDGDYYYVDGKRIINDWVQYNDKWYYLDTDGKYVRGDWKQVGNDWYYFNTNGDMLSNEWVDGKYYVDSNGKMLKDTITPDGYYVDVNGEYNENSMYSYVTQQSSVIQNQSSNIANEVLLNQIQKAKLVPQYAQDTTVDQIDTVTFGSYYQNNSSTKEPIEWLVLDRQGNKALLLSKYILDCKCYNEEHEDVTWETCTLRNWLNNTFYNTAFNNNEKNYILTTNVINSDNTVHNTRGGNNTNDKVFLLSFDEVKKYFYQSNMHDSNKRLATSGTNYAKTVDNFGEKLWVYYDNTAWYNGNTLFWLRSPGRDQDRAAIVGNGGAFSAIGRNVDKYNNGVRPAIWIKY